MTQHGKSISHAEGKTPDQSPRIVSGDRVSVSLPHIAENGEPGGAASGLLTGIVDERFRLLVKDEQTNRWVRVTLSREKAQEVRDSLNLFLEAG